MKSLTLTVFVLLLSSVSGASFGEVEITQTESEQKEITLTGQAAVELFEALTEAQESSRGNSLTRSGENIVCQQALGSGGSTVYRCWLQVDRRGRVDSFIPR